MQGEITFNLGQLNDWNLSLLFRMEYISKGYCLVVNFCRISNQKGEYG